MFEPPDCTRRYRRGPGPAARGVRSRRPRRRPFRTHGSTWRPAAPQFRAAQKKRAAVRRGTTAREHDQELQHTGRCERPGSWT